MREILIDFYEATSAIDLIYILITIFSLIKCYKNGFVLSILSMAKWLLAYVITLLIFPRVKPYLKDIVDSEYVLDIGLGITIFIIVFFLILMINKGISKVVSYSGVEFRYCIWIFLVYKSICNINMYIFRCAYSV